MIFDIDNANIREEIRCEQGSKEWHLQRLGKITASNFHKLMASGKDKSGFGGAALTYANEILGELCTNTWDESEFKATIWGKENEPLAREFYENKTGNKVELIGFILMGERQMIGFSPDGKIHGGKGIIEIKCPFTTKKHIDNLKSGDTCPEEYLAQCQGGMMVSGAEYCDFISFDPRMALDKLKMKIIRVERDEDYIDKLAIRLNQFENYLHQQMELIGAF